MESLPNIDEPLNHHRLSPSDPIRMRGAYFPNNPSAWNRPEVQGAQQRMHGIDRYSTRSYYDRVPVVQPGNIRRVQLLSGVNRELDANTNSYNPCKYPNPGMTATTFPARRLQPAPMNGSVCAFNAPNPRPLPPMVTNDVSYICSRF